MPRHEESRFLPFTPRQMYDLVVDVPTYPEFLPWCIGTRVYNQQADRFDADMIIGFKMFRERFTTRDTLTPPVDDQPGRIYIDYIKGPLRYLHNDWLFTADVQDGVSGCRIDFTVDFEFRNRIFEKMVGALFEEAVHRMVSAFETRAHEIYGG